MSTPLPDSPAFTGYDVAQSSPAPVRASHNSGELLPKREPAGGAGEAIPPPGYVLISQADHDRMMVLIAQLQNEREADRIDHADYNRLLEKERVELLEPMPIFLSANKPGGIADPAHCIPRLARERD